MGFLKNHKTVKEDKLFKSNGEFNLTQESSNMLDTVLIIIRVKERIDLYRLNLELRRCGFFISHPELKQVIKKLVKDRLIENANVILN